MTAHRHHLPGLAVLAMAAILTFNAVAFAAAPGAPGNLRCEYETNPMGIDVAQPRLSWEVNDSRRGASQSAYQVLVAASPAELAEGQGTLWDSGKVSSDQSIQVAYAGVPLASRQQCYWTVRTWDGEGQASPYAEAASWEMGLLAPQDWQARWIAKPHPTETKLPVGAWIWHPSATGNEQHVFLRKTFELKPADAVLRARAKMACDNIGEFFLNGEAVGKRSQWKSFGKYDVTDKLRPGKNVIAVDMFNQDGPGGFLFGMEIELDNGQSIEVLSDDSWMATPGTPEDAAALDFDDGKWDKAVVVHPFGEGPWGEVQDQAAARPVCVRKDFTLGSQAVKARVYASGLGLYELHINGQAVCDEVFSPGWTHYPSRVMYQTYDVTSLLRQGGNAIGLILGNGWWGQGMAGAWRQGPLRAICQLEVEYANGERLVVATDDAWTAHDSPIVEDSFYNGVTYDARLEMPGWDTAGFDAAGWVSAEVVDKPIDVLVAQVGPPLRVTEEIKAVEVTEPSPGVFVYDFGQNASGRARLRVKGPEGARVQMRFAEVLKADGNIYTENYRSARVTDVYILKGQGKEVWEPRFTYRGHRYCEVTGYPGTPAKDAVVMRVLHSDAPWAGAFECSNSLINQIQKNICWGQRSNLHSVPTDCPQRDERLGWTGDAQCFAPTSCWNMDMASFYTKWMNDLADSRHEDGSVTDVAPCLTWGPASPAWGDVVTVVPWTMYRFYGDTRILEEHFALMKGWVDYMWDTTRDGKFDRDGYGDWVAPVESPKIPIAAAYQYLSMDLLVRTGKLIGKEAEVEVYGPRLEQLRKEFQEKFFDADSKNYEGATQTANLLPLHFAITPEELQGAVAQNIANNAAEREYHLSTGFLGTAYLLPVLTQFGHHDTAYRLVTQRTYPSWGHMIEKGGTTIWERWNSDDIETVGAGMNSYNHFAFGSIGEWFFQSLAGIVPQEAGFKHILIQPRPVGDLTSAKAAYPSMYGAIRSEWRIKGGRFVLEVEAPANTTATVALPTADAASVREGGQPAGDAEGVGPARVEDGFTCFEVAAGTYRFEAPMK